MPLRPVPQSDVRISIPEILFEDDPPVPQPLGLGESVSTLFLQARSPGSVAVHWDVDSVAFQRFTAGTEDGCVWVRVWIGPESQGTVVYRAVWRESDTVLMAIPSRPGTLRAELGGWSGRREWRSISISDVTQSLAPPPACQPGGDERETDAAVAQSSTIAEDPSPTARILGGVRDAAAVDPGRSGELFRSRQRVALELFRLVGIANALDPSFREASDGIASEGMSSPWSGC